MTTLVVVTAENQKAGSVELSAAIFQAPVKPDLLHAEIGRASCRERV